ncbi:MAG TPA: hypothetical protein VGF13_06930 [Verrucomicrobiae bacterium]
MLTFLLIVGLVWLFVALVCVLALAAAARPQSSPSLVTEPLVMETQTRESLDDNVSAGAECLLPAESPVPT